METYLISFTLKKSMEDMLHLVEIQKAVRSQAKNRVAERKNRTIIKATRTMLADSLLPILIWAEAVNTACYVQNRVLLTKPHNKTPYELLLGRTPSIGFMRPFRCHVTILSTLNPLGNFDGKADEGFLVGYSISSKAIRVFNSRTRIVQETLHINFLENQPNVAGNGPTWLFDIDTLTQSMNYQLVVARKQPNSSAGSSDKTKEHDEKAKREAKGKSHVDLSTRVRDLSVEFEEFYVSNTNRVNAASAPITAIGPNSPNSTNCFNAAGSSDNAVSPNFEIDDEEDVGAEADFSNLETSITVNPIPKTRVHKDHRVTQIIDDLSLAPQTRSMARMVKEQENGFQKGNIDQTLFIKKQKGDILLVQVYVDDIIFGSTNKELCKAFEKLMKDKFQMSSMRELTFFLGLQVKQKDNGIFINQDKYVAEILRKFGLTDGKSASTLIDTEKPLLKDPDSEDVDVHIYRYLKGKPHLGLWYPKDSPFNLVAYSDSDYAGASLDRKYTAGGCQFLGCRLISWQCKKYTVVATSSTEAEYVAAASCCAQVLWIQNYNEALAIPGQTATGSASSCMSAKRTAWNEFSSSMASAVICLATVDDLSSHNTKYTFPTLTQKVFANIRRIGKGFSGVDTPLFDGMLVQQQVQAVEDAAEEEDDDNEVSTEPTPPSPTLATPPPSLTQEHILSPPQDRTSQPSSPSPQQPSQTVDISQAEQDKIAQAIKITNLKQRFWRLKKKRKFKSSRLKRLRKVGTTPRVESSADTIMDDQEDASKQGGITELDADEDVTLVDAKEDMNANDTDDAEPAEVEEVIEVVTAAKLMTEVVTTAATTITVDQVPKRIDEETKELKTHLQITANDDDDVNTEATPLALEVPVADYQIHHEHNKPYYKIIRADETHQLFLSFITLLKNFDRDDLEALWKLVKERFKSAEPNNFSDDFLLNTFNIMFEKPNVEANI
nr:ribonuclease H-like domain-containing protein [Tanacetum cinerariifolium]